MPPPPLDPRLLPPPPAPQRWLGGKRHSPPSPQGTLRVSGAPHYPGGPVDSELDDGDENSELDGDEDG